MNPSPWQRLIDNDTRRAGNPARRIFQGMHERMGERFCPPCRYISGAEYYHSKILYFKNHKFLNQHTHKMKQLLSNCCLDFA
jgi:hypothetical protein